VPVRPDPPEWRTGLGLSGKRRPRQAARLLPIRQAARRSAQG
jgi:hypothetical protein